MEQFIETFSGGMIDPLDPKPAQIKLVDIAHALSNICCFTGHTRTFYSVAQHSVLVASLLPDELKPWGLLHDASEAYLCDVARPVKRRLGGYATIEDQLMRVICVRFGLRWPMPAEVQEADEIMLAIEARDLMPFLEPPWRKDELPEPMGERIDPWAPDLAKIKFSKALCAARLVRDVECIACGGTGDRSQSAHERVWNMCTDCDGDGYYSDDMDVS